MIPKIKFIINQNAKKLKGVYKGDLLVTNMKAIVGVNHRRSTYSKKHRIGLYKVDI